MRKYLVMLLTVVACLYVVPVVFLLNVLVWWNVIVPAVHVYFRDLKCQEMGEVFIDHLSRPFTAVISAVRQTHQNIAAAL